MGCRGGCINGGGQPQPGYMRNSVDIRSLRAQVLYDADKNNPIRKSHENPAIRSCTQRILVSLETEGHIICYSTTYMKSEQI